MKKLYENIEDINIRGGVEQLSELVQAMDVSLQNIANNTDKLINILIKYSASNKGSQYMKVVQTTSNLRDVMFTASEKLNEMQNQIVAYQNKIYRYEEMSQNAVPPNPYLVTKRQVNVEVTATQFNRTDMLTVAAALRNYREIVYQHIRSVNKRKNEVAIIWLDTQYKDFASFVDEVTRCVLNALNVYEEYVACLEERIKELG